MWGRYQPHQYLPPYTIIVWFSCISQHLDHTVVSNGSMTDEQWIRSNLEGTDHSLIKCYTRICPKGLRMSFSLASRYPNLRVQHFICLIELIVPSFNSGDNRMAHHIIMLWSTVNIFIRQFVRSKNKHVMTYKIFIISKLWAAASQQMAHSYLKSCKWIRRHITFLDTILKCNSIKLQ
jgi:hypothetical protein